MEAVDGPFVSVNTSMQGEGQSIKSGGFVLVSGCLCMDPAAMVHVSMDDVRKQTSEILKQMEAILLAAGTSLSQRGQQVAAEEREAAGLRQHGAGPLVTSGAVVVESSDGKQRYACSHPSCTKTFKSKDNLQKHLARHSDQIRLLVCNKRKLNGEICNFQSIDAGKMSNHKKYSLAHNRKEDFPFVCPSCTSRFPRRHEFDRHVKICKGRGPKEAKRRHLGLGRHTMLYSDVEDSDRQLHMDLVQEEPSLQVHNMGQELSQATGDMQVEPESTLHRSHSMQQGHVLEQEHHMQEGQVPFEQAETLHVNSVDV